jgi:RHS repeat-associated protein
MTTGVLTATRTAVLGTPTNMLCSMMYYDDNGRTIKTFKQHYYGGTINAGNYDENVTTYNFTDQPISTTRKHYLASVLKVTIADSIAYDHMGRKIKSWRQLTNGTGAADAKILLNKTDYNEVGQLKNKNLHSTDGTTFKQAVAYSYNERGWLQSSSAPLFAMQLKYTDGSAPQYNGNIANQLWGVPGTLDKTYTYRYDNINRLLSGASTTNDRERSIVYDKMGNITNLTRFSNNVIIDSLNYNYTISGIATNQLQSVNDLTTSVLGQRPGNFTYAYDGNGNMVTDNSKGITISYNMLNLPLYIAAKNTSYSYDAGGNKLRRIVGTTATEYIDGIQYDSGNLSFIKTEEGRAFPNGATAYNYEYTISDHLGNSRVGFDIFNNAARLVQTSNYYPFGLEAFSNTASSPKNYYLYNKKELQENLGLYDYGARFYDPVIARWQVVDKLAEHPTQIDMSPYAYVGNNPILKDDPDGNCPCLIPIILEGAALLAEATGIVAITDAAVVTTSAIILYNMTGNGAVGNSSTIPRRDATSYSAPIPARAPVIAQTNSNGKKGSEGNPQPTSRAARRDAQRKGGVPTSQPLHQDKAAKTKDQVLLDRDGNNTVQDAKNDSSHPNNPHWEAGPTKKDPSQPDGLNRSGNNNKPQMAKPKGKSHYEPSNSESAATQEKKN